MTHPLQTGGRASNESFQPDAKRYQGRLHRCGCAVSMLLNKVRLADGLGSPEGKPKWASRPRGAAQCHPGVLVLLLGATCMACGFAAGATCLGTGRDVWAGLATAQLYRLSLAKANTCYFALLQGTSTRRRLGHKLVSPVFSWVACSRPSAARPQRSAITHASRQVDCRRISCRRQAGSTTMLAARQLHASRISTDTRATGQVGEGRSSTSLACYSIRSPV